MSHEALERPKRASHAAQRLVCRSVPRRNPELVVAVLWQNGEFSYYPARLGARVVAAYVEKQRRLAEQPDAGEGAECPTGRSGRGMDRAEPCCWTQGEPATKVQAGKFYVGANGTVTGATDKSADCLDDGA